MKIVSILKNFGLRTPQSPFKHPLAIERLTLSNKLEGITSMKKRSDIIYSESEEVAESWLQEPFPGLGDISKTTNDHDLGHAEQYTSATVFVGVCIILCIVLVGYAF